MHQHPPGDRRSALARIGLGLTAPALWLPPALAQSQTQTLPETARIIVGYPAGGGIDLIARRLAEELGGKLAKAVIVDNRPGAAGRIAVDIAKASPADGLTLLLSPAGVLTINPHTYKKSNYDPFNLNCQTGGRGRPIHTIAWISTLMPAMPATEAAAVCMQLALGLPSGP